jgi:aminoacrylate hydrolase
MPTADVNGIQIAYDVQGDGDPVMLITGLGGVGRAWGATIDRFAAEYLTIVPDHRGCGQSTGAEGEFTIEQHAADMAEALRRIGCGPAHLVGSSTGGAIAQVMALDHPDVVRSITLVSSWPGADDFFHHQFAVRKQVLDELGAGAYSELSALFLFSPDFISDNYPAVRAWCDKSSQSNPSIMTRRIDMVVAFDLMDRLGGISVPTLVLVGDQDACTPPHLSRRLAGAIDGAELQIVEGGHLIYTEEPEAFHRAVRDFVSRH